MASPSVVLFPHIPKLHNDSETHPKEVHACANRRVDHQDLVGPAQEGSHVLSIPGAGLECSQAVLFLMTFGLRALSSRTGTEEPSKHRHVASSCPPLHHGRPWKSLMHMASKRVSFCLLFSLCQLVSCYHGLSWPPRLLMPSLRVYANKTHHPEEVPSRIQWLPFLRHWDVWGMFGGFGCPQRWVPGLYFLGWNNDTKVPRVSQPEWVQQDPVSASTLHVVFGPIHSWFIKTSKGMQGPHAYDLRGLAEWQRLPGPSAAVLAKQGGCVPCPLSLMLHPKDSEGNSALKPSHVLQWCGTILISRMLL